MTDLQREAREAALAEYFEYSGPAASNRRTGYVSGYLAAAAPREQEIEEKDERISNLSHSCVAAIERAIGAERELAALRARVKELEGMVPRPCSECGGVGVVETYRAEHASGCTDTRCMSSCPQPVQVMVPCDCCGGNGAIMVPTIHKGGL